MAINRQYELLESVEDDGRKLMAQHKEQRKTWHIHDFIPWEKGRSFVEEPWDESQCTISPAARTALVLNLLTEDNLPYYHEAIGRYMPEDSAFSEWTHLWTAEEGQHAIAMRSYLLTSRNCDPNQLEVSRMATMTKGYESPWLNPIEAFAYTSTQELATRVSHRNAGKITDDPVAFRLMKLIATDENHHFIFYRGVMSAMLRESPSDALEGIYRVFTNFEMPGLAVPRFRRLSIEVARAGVYNLRVHHDHVLTHLIREWKLGELIGLTPRAAELQERILNLPAAVLRKAEAFEKRFGAGS